MIAAPVSARTHLALVAALGLLLAAVPARTALAGPGAARSPGGARDTPARQVTHPLHATRGGEHPRILDDRGRQVLLRGVNVVQLGDYYQADPDSPATFPLSERDFEQIAALGFNVVRLVVHWSALEPEPGRIDAGSVTRIQQAVDWARDHDIYVILDMHQDAWGKQPRTPPDGTCPPPLSRSIGWDGAPAWATLTGAPSPLGLAEAASTCKLQQRELSPAVAEAFTNFWTDRPAPDGVGIQDHLVGVWADLAGRFASDPAVAGYDLFNEPHPGLTPGLTDTVLLGAFYDRAIDAIRSAEAAGSGPPGRRPPSSGAAGRDTAGRGHIVFFEPIVTWSASGVAPPVQPAFTTDDNLVFAPHLYAGSLSPTPGVGVDEGFDAAAAVAAVHGTTFWSGEWGWFGDPAADAGRVATYAAREDAEAVGGAWWSWRQACGDPHVQQHDPGNAAGVSPSLVRYRCPGNVRLGIPDRFARILSRAYPRAAPGRITALSSDPAAGTIHLEGIAGAAGGEAVDLWVPDRGRGSPMVSGRNVGPASIRSVPGGWRVRAPVAGQYAVDVRPARP